MNIIYILGFIWVIIALISTTDSFIYKYCKHTLRTGASGTKFQRFYAYKFHHRAYCIIYIANLICVIIGCCILCVYIIKFIWDVI